MPVEPWPAYMPEVNAGRYEGTGPGTWMMSGDSWVAFAGLVAEAIGVIDAELATVAANWHGAAPLALSAATAPFMAWLATAEANNVSNALACYAVATAYAAGEGTMVPLPEINLNRVSELIAEATNFLGINSGIIAALNADYARMWGENGATMMTYDEAVTTATVPKPVTPPPPLSSAAAASGALGETVAESAAKDAASGASQAATQGLTDSVDTAAQGSAQGAELPQSAMSTLLGSAGQLTSMPGQVAGQFGTLGQTLSSPMQSLTSPFQSLLGTLGGQTAQPATFGLGGPEAAFAGVNAAGAGSGASFGGGGAVMGGGLGGAMMSPAAYMGASGGPVKSQQVFAGVSNKPTAVVPGAAGAAGAGGMVPAGRGHGATTSSNTRTDKIIAVDESQDEDATAAEARALFQ